MESALVSLEQVIGLWIGPAPIGRFETSRSRRCAITEIILAVPWKLGGFSC